MKTIADNTLDTEKTRAAAHLHNSGNQQPTGEAVQGLDSSPRQIAQALKIAQLHTPVAQKQSLEEDEGLIQNKQAPLQRSIEEEEEPLQNKRATLQRQAEEEEEPLQNKRATLQRQAEEEEELIQNKALPTSTPQNGLPGPVQTSLETTFGHDFSNVSIHKSSSKATQVGALAFAQGNDIHFAPGQFNPHTSSGRQIIGHEFAHVVQQREGRVNPTTQVAGMPVNDNPSLEKEADVQGAKIDG